MKQQKQVMQNLQQTKSIHYNERTPVTLGYIIKLS